MTNTVSLAETMKHLAAMLELQQPSYRKMSPSTLNIEQYVIDRLAAEAAAEEVFITNRELEETFNLSRESVRKSKLQMMSSERWAIIPGTSETKTVTSYRPLFTLPAQSQAGDE